MSPRVRDLLHQLADAVADDLESGTVLVAPQAVAAPTSSAPPARSTPKPRRAPVRLPPAPTTPPSEIDRARARRVLSGLGFVETKS